MNPQWKCMVEQSTISGKKKKVKIEGKCLTRLPLDVFSVNGLKALEMSPERESCLSFRMNAVPREIGKLTSLTVLYMDSNNLTDIPPALGLLTNLHRLTLSNNSLTALPTEFGRLQNLRSLHLANNSFTDLPDQVCQLKNLIFLDASDNRIQAIPHSIKNLKKLETLLLLFNCLEYLPESFGRLKNLHSLWLGNNNLKSLPVSFANLVNLDWVENPCSCNFEGNPLECPPEEVCKQGPQKIKQYYHAQVNQMNESGSQYPIVFKMEV